MTRRNFLAVLSGAAAWPLTGRAQENTLPVIGFLSSGSLSALAKPVDAFRDGLREEGYVENSNVLLAYRWAEGNYEALDALATDLVRNRVHVIAATGGVVSAKAAIRATSTVPVVFVVGFDPVQLGLVASLNKPGGNATGVSIFTTELAVKRLELLQRLVPGSSIVAILVNPKSIAAEIETKETIAAAQLSGRAFLVLNASTAAEIDMAFASAVEQRVSAVLVSADPVFTTRSEQLVALAERHAMPAVYPVRRYYDAGGLMSYGPELEWAYRRIGQYAGRILKGARPSDIPVELPVDIKLLINLKAANAIGLNVPSELVAVANEIIE
jgi:putative tryptophan/tyrosine transport system substrate-binding protein